MAGERSQPRSALRRALTERRVDEHRVIGAAALAPMIALTEKLTEGRL
jgi:hypothetical protein